MRFAKELAAINLNLVQSNVSVLKVTRFNLAVQKRNKLQKKLA